MFKPTYPYMPLISPSPALPAPTPSPSNSLRPLQPSNDILHHITHTANTKAQESIFLSPTRKLRPISISSPATETFSKGSPTKKAWLSLKLQGKKVASFLKKRHEQSQAGISETEDETKARSPIGFGNLLNTALLKMVQKSKFNLELDEFQE